MATKGRHRVCLSTGVLDRIDTTQRRESSLAAQLLRGPPIVAVGAVALVAVVIALCVFQPWRMFTNREVNESLLASLGSSAAVLVSGEFRSLLRDTTGRAQLVELPGGGHVVQFTDLDTGDSPGLLVYLSEKDSAAAAAEFDTGYVELGRLKGNQGNQVYAIPVGTDLARYRGVVIWCERFSTGFGVAPLVGEVVRDARCNQVHR